MTSHIFSISPQGFDGQLVDIEGDSNHGLPGFHIVGMANKTVSEATERVRSAITNSGLSFPSSKIIVNLAPAELTKDGSFLDLPIALAVLTLSKQLRQPDTDGKLFVGELSLDGHLRPVRGIINIVESARSLGFKEVYLPFENAPQASLIEGVSIFPVRTLLDLILHLKHQKPLDPAPPYVVKNTKTDINDALFNQIHGQELAKRALSIAIAGKHNILLSGPPGAGKTMLAKAALELLPPLTNAEQIAVTKLHGLVNLNTNIISSRPFRNPHHSCSMPSLIGGGAKAQPGEISLAHHGILFLDELPEYNRQVLESLRQPLEDKQVTITRANAKYTYPADFMLIATMNPCPCGYYNDPTHECTCTSNEIRTYERKLSGPLLDRIDIRLTVQKVKTTDLSGHPTNSAAVVKNTITDVIARQHARYNDQLTYNGSLSATEVAKYVDLSPDAKDLLSAACDRLNLSARSYFKIIKVARTIADFEAKDLVEASHVAEALSFR